jgi:anti-sigma factor RsiW
MTLLSCATVLRRLHAFYDCELAVGDLIAIEAHVHDCPPCARELRELRDVGDALRLAAAPGPADDWTGLRPGVISRMRAEEHESWTARMRRAFDDMHLVWIGLASTAATCVCAGAVLSMLHFASPERNNSLAAMIMVKSAPSGSDLNPASLDGRIQAPSVPHDGIVYATLESATMQGDSVVPLSAVVTREGRVSGLELLGSGHHLSEVVAMVDALSRGHLEPAQFGGSPVAVNLVWLVAHTTVKGKPRS